MLRTLANKNGQGVTVQYATIFAIVFTVITAMSVYFRRVVQSRYAGVMAFSKTSINAIFNSPENYNLTSNFFVQYEPYYIISQSEKTIDGTVIEREQGGIGMASIHEREFQDYQTTTQSFSNQLSPRYADN